MADEPQDASSEIPIASPPDDEEVTLHEGDEFQDAREEQTIDDDSKPTESTEKEMNEEMNEEENGQENEMEAEEGPEVETRQAGDVHSGDIDGHVRNSQDAVGQEGDSEEGERVENQLGDGLKGNEAAGCSQSNELKLDDGSVSRDVAARGSGREGLELNLEENKQEEGWFQLVYLAVSSFLPSVLSNSVCCLLVCVSVHLPPDYDSVSPSVCPSFHVTVTVSVLRPCSDFDTVCMSVCPSVHSCTVPDCDGVCSSVSMSVLPST